MRKLNFILIISLSGILIYLNDEVNLSITQSKFKKVHSFAALNYLTSLKLKDQTRCLIMCNNEASCLTVNYNSSTQNCTLYSSKNDTQLAASSVVVYEKVGSLRKIHEACSSDAECVQGLKCTDSQCECADLNNTLDFLENPLCLSYFVCFILTSRPYNSIINQYF